MAPAQLGHLNLPPRLGTGWAGLRCAVKGLTNATKREGERARDCIRGAGEGSAPLPGCPCEIRGDRGGSRGTSVFSSAQLGLANTPPKRTKARRCVSYQTTAGLPGVVAFGGRLVGSGGDEVWTKRACPCCHVRRGLRQKAQVRKAQVQGAGFRLGLPPKTWC